MTIGDRIKQAREKKGISQTELAESIGASKQTLYKYEMGIITNIPSDKIEAIARKLEVSPAYLMGWEQQPDAHPPDELLQVILNRLATLGITTDNSTSDLTSLQTLIRLADKHNVSLDYLVGRTEKNVPIQADRDVFVEVFSRLTEQEIDSLIDYAKYLLSKR